MWLIKVTMQKLENKIIFILVSWFMRNCAIFIPEACWYLLLLFDTKKFTLCFNQRVLLKSSKENCLAINPIKSVSQPEEGIYNEYSVTATSLSDRAHTIFMLTKITLNKKTQKCMSRVNFLVLKDISNSSID